MENDASKEIWPSQEYHQQVENLQNAVGQTVFLAEINHTAINSGIKISDEERILLAVIDFPKPDPYKQLYPHMLVLDDGRGINLGHIARISIKQAFGPDTDNILYQRTEFVREVLFAPRQLSRTSITATSTDILAQMFGDKPGMLLESTRNKKDRLNKS